MKSTFAVSLEAVHIHTQGILINEKVKKDSKSLVLKNDTG